MKKILNYVNCFLCICISILVTGIPVYAAGAIDVDKNVSFTIVYQNEEKQISDAKFDVYLIANVDAYAQMTLTDKFSNYPIDFVGLNQDEWETLATTLKSYVWYDSILPDFSGETDTNGMLQMTLKPGLYLVVGNRISIDEYTYSATPYLVFLPESNQVDNTWTYDVSSYPKSLVEKNPVLTSRKVLKIWDDLGKVSNRPQEIVIHLMKDGEVYDTVSLNADNNWRYTWTDLEEDHDWLVYEEKVVGYTQSISQDGGVFTVKNTISSTTPSDSIKPSDTTLPLTGMLWWPVPVMFACGLLFITIGLIRRKGGNCE